MNRNSILKAVLLTATILTVLPTVQAGELISYQGRLTESSGDPVDNGNYPLTFSLWDDSTAGTQQWSEIHASVPVTDGLFSVNLGKDGGLDASIFETEPLFLQIQVGYGDIISPRTRLTSAPSAVKAKRVDGDVETGEGYLNLNSTSGEIAFSMTAAERAQANFRMYNINPGYLGQTQLELITDNYGGHIKLYPSGEIQSGPAFTVGFEPTPFRRPYMSLYDPGGSFPDDPAIKMGIEPSPFMEMTEQSLGYGDRPTMRMGFEPSPFHHGYIAMYNPEVGPPPKLLEVGINDSTGEWESRIKMRLVHPPEYPTGKDILTISSAPSTGASIKMATPLPEPPKPLLEMNVYETEIPDDWASEFKMYLMEPPDIPTPKEIFSISSSPSTGASIKMATPLPEPPATIMEMKVDEVTGPTASYGSYFNMYSMDPANGGRETFEVSNTLTDGISFKMFNPQPEPPAVYFNVNADPAAGPSMGFYDEIGQVMGLEPMPFNEAFSMRLIDPTDEKNLLEISANHVTDESTIRLIDPSDERNLLTINSSPLTGGHFRMFNPQPEPPARLLNIETNPAKASDDIVMELTSGDSLYQTKITPGRVKVGHPTSDNRPRSEMNAGADTVTFYLQGYSGYTPAPPIVMMSGGTEAKMGIGTMAPTEELHVVGDICYTGSIGACSDVRYKKDIKTLGNALDRVSRLRGVSFNWKKDEFPQNKFSPESQVGLIAQEVIEVFPEVVSEDNKGYYNIDYTKITPLLIEAIKELKSENERLKSRIEKLEAQ